MDYLSALFLGFVEGITEFLPVSSTAHLTLTSELLGLKQTDFQKTFVIVIQPGAILAVLVLYGRSLLVKRQVLARVAVAFLPTGLLGVTVYKLVKQHLLDNHPLTLLMLAGGGLALIVFELWHRERAEAEADLAQLSWRDCFLVGCFQTLAFVPGVSRAAATIIGGLLLGWRRKAAVEFSFLLAVPTMIASTALDLWKSSGAFSLEQVQLLVVGFVTSFVVALLAIHFLLRYIRTHTFIPFGIYRLIFALVLGIWLYAL